MSGPSRIKEIDALRGYAALAVVLFHFTMFREEARFGFRFGCMGVDLFFVISGFVILLTVERSRDWRRFLINRFSRLYPAYWACVTLTAVVMLAIHQVRPDLYAEGLLPRYLGNMTMVQYYLGIHDIDGPYWTLIIELVFYVFILALLLTGNIVRVERYGALMLLVSAFYAYPGTAGSPLLQALLRSVPLLAYFPLFYAGILVYRMKFDRITRMRIVLFLSTLLVQCLLFSTCYRNRSAFSPGEYAAVLSGIYAVFLLYLFGKLHPIVNPMGSWLGKVSYSLYLIHQFIGTLVIIPLLMGPVGLPFWPSFLIALVVVLLLAGSINRYVEEPLLRSIRQRMRDRPAGSAPVAPVAAPIEERSRG